MKKTTQKSSAPSKSVKETLVVFVLDKSGSMGSIANATRSGFNEYVDELKKDKKASYSMSLTVFDTNVEQLYTNKAIKEVEKLTSENYIPSGMTALYDAAMETIEAVESQVKKGQKVLCVLMTDGEENSSKEYTDKHLKDKIQALEKKGNWTFVFLGANQDSWLVGQKFGLKQQNVANYSATDKGMSATFTMMAANTRGYASSASLNTAAFFSKEDQQNLENTK